MAALPLRGFCILSWAVSELVRSRKGRPTCGRGQELDLLLGFNRGFVLGLHGVLEILNAFAKTLCDLRDLLAPEEQHRDSEHDHQLSAGKTAQTGSLKILRIHVYGYLSATSVTTSLEFAQLPETLLPSQIRRISANTAQLDTITASGTICSVSPAAIWPSVHGAIMDPTNAKEKIPLKYAGW